MDKNLQDKITECNVKTGLTCLPIKDGDRYTGGIIGADPSFFCDVKSFIKYRWFGSNWWKTVLWIVLTMGIWWFAGVIIGAFIIVGFGIDDPNGNISLVVGEIIGLILVIGIWYIIRWFTSCGGKVQNRAKYLEKDVEINLVGSDAYRKFAGDFTYDPKNLTPEGKFKKAKFVPSIPEQARPQTQPMPSQRQPMTPPQNQPIPPSNQPTNVRSIKKRSLN